MSRCAAYGWGKVTSGLLNCVPFRGALLRDAGEPPPADFLQIRRVARILSKEALLDYAPDHEQRDKHYCHRQIEHRVASNHERQKRDKRAGIDRMSHKTIGAFRDNFAL